MPEVAELLLALADPPLGPPEEIGILERRVRQRRRRRRTGLAATGLACIAAVGLSGLGLLGRQGRPRTETLTTAQTTVDGAAVPPTPEDPSGRFLPTWLPGDLRVQTEVESAASTSVGASGWNRTYVRGGPMPGDQDVLTISLQSDAGPLDVNAEIGRYAGARRIDVQGRPGLYLPRVAARSDASLAWSPGPALLAQVRGSGVSEAELTAVAEGFQLPPGLDATPVPQGFSELQRSDDRPLPAPTPRRYSVSTTPSGGPATNPEAPVPGVLVISAFGLSLPDAPPAEPVRGRPAVLSVIGPDTTISWLERPDLMVTVTGTSVGTADVRRVAAALREQSMEEVLSRPTGETVVVASGNIGGGPYELRVRWGPSGPCLELAHGWLVSACASDPTRAVGDLSPSSSQGVAFGPVIVGAGTVRLELAGGGTVETPAVGQAAGQGAAFYVAVLPPGSKVLAVVAIGPDGGVLGRTPVG